MLRVRQALFRHFVTVTVDGADVVRMPRSTQMRPWVEQVLPDDDHTIVVALMLWTEVAFQSTVFVDGVSLRDGATLESARADAPVAKDRFEMDFRGDSFFLRPYGAVLAGLIFSSPLLVAILSRPTPSLVLIYAIATGVLVTYMLGLGWFIRWLRTMRRWPARLRILLVLLVVIVLPVLVLLVLQATT